MPITPRVAEDLQADWNAEPVDKVEDARESLEIDAEQLRGIVDAESEGEDVGLPAILDSSPQPDANLSTASIKRRDNVSHVDQTVAAAPAAELQDK